ncbi:hypothetical protein LZD49_14165 [Dyadobacter sp. CY261]|uniref:hypothetical protein n=1 Tax=Dyadobacter sp. CY261 TaxID=2907203 RepID=UPI001F2104AE|nr:hypothetical protein [Dyadobacter sp. CY261]MCF0071619.1 hypothetical protein [Dyadobacter sp. CY261]
MKTERVINQAISLMLAVMLLMVAGARSWSDHAELGHFHGAKTEAAAKGLAKHSDAQSGQAEQPEVSALSLDAVITPAISFDFYQYLYFVPQPIWHFVAKRFVARISFIEPVFLVSYFQRIFGRFVVTNAP